MNTPSPRLDKEQYEQHSKRLKDEIEMYGKLMRQKIGSPKEVQYLALRQKAALNTLRTLNEKYFTGGYNRMQNPGLQIEIPQLNEEALLQEPMNNNVESVNTQATIVNRGMNISNGENDLSVYEEEEDEEIKGGRRKRKHSRKAVKKTRKGKKMVRKAKKHTRKSSKKGRKGTKKTRRCWSRK